MARAKAKTREEFMDAMDNAAGCYVYIVDDNGCMHFLADDSYRGDFCDSLADDSYRGDFCDSLADAFMCSEGEAEILKFMGNVCAAEKIYHIVKIHTSVEWR